VSVSVRLYKHVDDIDVTGVGANALAMSRPPPTMTIWKCSKQFWQLDRKDPFAWHVAMSLVLTTAMYVAGTYVKF
jgi:hypothetical protein